MLGVRLSQCDQTCWKYVFTWDTSPNPVLRTSGCLTAVLAGSAEATKGKVGRALGWETMIDRDASHELTVPLLSR